MRYGVSLYNEHIVKSNKWSEDLKVMFCNTDKFGSTYWEVKCTWVIILNFHFNIDKSQGHLKITVHPFHIRSGQKNQRFIKYR